MNLEIEKLKADDKAPISISNNNLKQRHRDKSDLGDNFVAPDGGYAWVVCVAAGLSYLCLLPILQVFGLLFHDRFIELGITGTQMTTMANAQIAVTACSGLLNGPIFRRFSFRQVALAGAIVSSIAVFALSFATCFAHFIIWFSVVLGLAMGLSLPSISLAVNTYFKLNRRRALSYQWTITGLGPIFLPYLVNVLLYHYGVQGTLICFSGLTLHCIALSLIFQPVKWHVRKTESQTMKSIPNELRKFSIQPCEYCEKLSKTRKNSIFASQYLFSEDDEEFPGYEVVDPNTPMCSKANDGWFSVDEPERRKRMSISSAPRKVSTVEKGLDQIDENSEQINRDLKPNHFNNVLETNKKINEKLRLQIGPCNKCFCVEKEKLLLENSNQANINSKPNNDELCKDDNDYNNKKLHDDADNIREEDNWKWYHKVIVFFDLDLLKDFTFLNIMLGITFANFNEQNSQLLTAFYLKDFGFNNEQVAMIMSFQAIADIIVRFLIPICTERINWSNRTFFLIGITGLAIFRALISMVLSFEVTIFLFVLLGISRAFRIIFIGLVLPSYVPLKRLPAATGLQLLVSGILTLCFGPLIGLIKDYTNYTVTLNILNLFTLITIIMWTVEIIIKKKRKRNSENFFIQDKNHE